MGSEAPDLKQTLEYFQARLVQYGPTPRGVDWNSEAAQEIRFDQLARVLDLKRPFSVLDYGCGYGALVEYLLRKGYLVEKYVGFDILEGMIDRARERFAFVSDAPVFFTSHLEEVPQVDFGIVSGTFNIKLEATYEEWTRYVISELSRLNDRCQKGFAFNLLTKYSDAEYMKPHLYYADPCYFFDYCKKNFSRNVALLHDYEVYDFTILVRKSPAV